MNAALFIIFLIGSPQIKLAGASDASFQSSQVNHYTKRISKDLEDLLREKLEERNKHERVNANLHVDKHNEMFSGNKSAEVGTRVRAFITRLKSYIVNWNFLTETFMTEVHVLGEELEKISMIAVDEFPQEKIFNQISSAKKMFREITVAAEQLQGLCKQKTLHDQLICCVIELNVCILAMYDDQDKPDSSVSGYARKVSYMWSLLQRWTNQFASLSTAPLITRVAFEKQRSRAALRLHNLAEFLAPEMSIRSANISFLQMEYSKGQG